MEIGFHASHEQFTPRDLLDLTKTAEGAGFKAAMCSDHFAPWSEWQGQSGHAWTWLGAALQATGMSFGVVCTPGWRNHPVVLAQAIATLDQMFPGRFWVALGSGQLMNEGVTGYPWPAKSRRNDRLLASVRIVRRLLAGETVSFDGHVLVHDARLHTLPASAPLILGAAITPETAEWVGSWADGLITISKPVEKVRSVVDAFRRGGGRNKPMYMQCQISYASTDEEALQGAWDQWRSAVLDSSAHTELRFPEQLDAAAEFVKPQDMHGHICISCDLDKHIQWLFEYADLGFERLYLHNVNRAQERFIQEFGKHVLPAMSRYGVAHAG